MKSREHITTSGRAAFYACIWDDLRNAAMDCGWALALHGSLKSDMDIMAMPWVEDAKPVEVMIKALSDCFTENPFKDEHLIPHKDKPHGRTVYTMSIWADFHLDISVASAPHSQVSRTITENKIREGHYTYNVIEGKEAEQATKDTVGMREGNEIKKHMNQLLKEIVIRHPNMQMPEDENFYMAYHFVKRWLCESPSGEGKQLTNL